MTGLVFEAKNAKFALFQNYTVKSSHLKQIRRNIVHKLEFNAVLELLQHKRQYPNHTQLHDAGE